MSIWIFQTGEPLPSDNEPHIRPMRAMNLAEYLCKDGHHVVLWSSSFYHQKKIHRSRKFTSIHVNEKLTVNLIPSLGYSNHISFRRFIDHIHLAFNLFTQLQKTKLDFPSSAFIGYPPIEAAWVFTKWLRKNGIPFYVDLKDLWPLKYINLFPAFLRPLANILFLPFTILATSTLHSASAISAPSTTLLNTSLALANRHRNSNDCVLPLSSSPPSFDTDILSTTFNWWRSRGIDLSHRNRFIFIGTHSSVFDFTPIREALEYTKPSNYFEIVICGSGPETSRLRQLFSGIDNVFFPGWVNSVQGYILAQNSLATLAPYRNLPDFVQSIPNKIIDSLMYSLPIITGLQGEVQTLVCHNKVGFYCDDVHDWTSAFDDLTTDYALQQMMSLSASKLYQQSFERSSVYSSFIESLISL